MINETEHNPLYPVFLKLQQLHLLIVGAGEVGYEKLFFILKSSPQARITLLATWVNPEIKTLLAERPGHHVDIILKAFTPDDVKNHFDMVIAATNFSALNEQIRDAAKAQGKLVNVADTPELCDFYLGSIVTKGWLKVAISTNGKSPTFAKRFRQVLEEVLPEETSTLLNHLHTIRGQLKLDFNEKVKKLNDLTSSLVNRPTKIPKDRFLWQRLRGLFFRGAKRAS